MELADVGLTATETEYLSLYFYDNLSLSQIGLLYGVTKVAVKKRLDRLLLRLDEAKIPRPKRLQESPPIRKHNIDPDAIDDLVQGGAKRFDRLTRGGSP